MCIPGKLLFIYVEKPSFPLISRVLNKLKDFNLNIKPSSFRGSFIIFFIEILISLRWKEFLNDVSNLNDGSSDAEKDFFMLKNVYYFIWLLFDGFYDFRKFSFQLNHFMTFYYPSLLVRDPSLRFWTFSSTNSSKRRKSSLGLFCHIMWKWTFSVILKSRHSLCPIALEFY